MPKVRGTEKEISNLATVLMISVTTVIRKGIGPLNVRLRGVKSKRRTAPWVMRIFRLEKERAKVRVERITRLRGMRRIEVSADETITIMARRRLTLVS